MTKLYEYSPQTGELIAANPATPDPKHPGQYLARLNSTFTAPPATGEHEAAVWKNGKWEITPDWRDTTYYTRDESGQVQQIEIKELGQTVPEGAYLNREDVPPVPLTPDQLRSQFDAAVTARLDTFARTPYAADEQPFDSMDKARLASLTTDYRQWGDIANRLYDTTWKAAEALVPEVMDGTLTIEQAIDKLPALSWETA